FDSILTNPAGAGGQTWHLGIQTLMEHTRGGGTLGAGVSPVQLLGNPHVRNALAGAIAGGLSAEGQALAEDRPAEPGAVLGRGLAGAAAGAAGGAAIMRAPQLGRFVVGRAEQIAKNLGVHPDNMGNIEANARQAMADA